MELQSDFFVECLSVITSLYGCFISLCGSFCWSCVSRLVSLCETVVISVFVSDCLECELLSDIKSLYDDNVRIVNIDLYKAVSLYGRLV